jgi:signal transduction histidine kinase
VCDGIDGGRFRADPQQLKQVLMNLVHNAAESIGHDGVITLRAHQGTSRLNSKPTQVVMLEVEDNGPGIPTDVQDRLFDPFYSTKEQGTGLGLPIARRIIEKHGGDLQFESEPGQGALFRIVLPLYREESDHG